ncbi:MAG TPA: hypothetical protein VFY90_07460 [Tepidiformaceae bacterium]|nr:hypothetical protein [Tepidiformaceae bacterium]
MHEPALHPPAEPEPARIVPAAPLLVRGIGLLVLTAATIVSARALMRVSSVLVPVAIGLLAGAFLAAWGAAVALTGGEKVDDHPWV